MSDFGGSTSSNSGSSTSTNTPIVPKALHGILQGPNPYGNNVSQILQMALGGIPGLASDINNMPTQGTAPLNPSQLFDINSIQNLSKNPFALNPQESSASNTYNWLSQGPNAAVPYGEQAFESMTAPTLESQMSLAGLGNSGALGENLAVAGEQMALPLAEQGFSNAATGAAGMANLGGASYAQGTQNLQNALTAAGIPQEQAQTILNNVYQQQLLKTQAGMSLEEMISSWLPDLIGSKGKSSGSSNSTGMQFGLSL